MEIGFGRLRRSLLDGWHLQQNPEAVHGALAAVARSLETIDGADFSREVAVTQSVAPGRPPLSSRATRFTTSQAWSWPLAKSV